MRHQSQPSTASQGMDWQDANGQRVASVEGLTFSLGVAKREH
ncbi:hypothetical protein [Spirosoma sp. KCTC 42546]|nr:hypothetical protein [Spirosoma sp. KCTC 42546]